MGSLEGVSNISLTLTQEEIPYEFKLEWLNATLKFIKNDREWLLKYPEMPSNRIKFLKAMIVGVNCNVGIDFKNLYAPLWEALRIFGLQYEFRMSVQRTNNSYGHLFLEKIPRRQDAIEIGSSELESSFSSNSTTDATKQPKKQNQNQIADNKKFVDTIKKITDSISPLFIKNTLYAIFEFLSDEAQASCVFDNLARVEAQFIQQFLGILKRRTLLEEQFSPLCNKMWVKIGDVLDNNTVYKIQVSSVTVDKETAKRCLTLQKIPMFSDKQTSKSKSPRKRIKKVIKDGGTENVEPNVVNVRENRDVSSILLKSIENCQNKIKPKTKKDVSNLEKSKEPTEYRCQEVKATLKRPITKKLRDVPIKTPTELEIGVSRIACGNNSTEPVIEKAVMDKTVMDKAVIDKAVIDKTVIDKAVMDKAVMDNTVIDKTVIDKAVTDKVVINKAVMDKPVVDKAVTDKAVMDKTVIDKAVIDKAVTDKTVIDKTVIDKAVIDKALIDKTVSGKKVKPLPKPLPTMSSTPSIDRLTNTAGLCKRKVKLIEALSTPIESDIGLRMMRCMGWEGGALGAREGGITEPIMPALHLVPKAGLGHEKDEKKKPENNKTRSEIRIRILESLLELLKKNLILSYVDFENCLNRSEIHFLDNVKIAFNKRKQLGLNVKIEIDLVQNILTFLLKNPSVQFDVEVLSRMRIKFAKIPAKQNLKKMIGTDQQGQTNKSIIQKRLLLNEPINQNTQPLESQANQPSSSQTSQTSSSQTSQTSSSQTSQTSSSQTSQPSSNQTSQPSSSQTSQPSSSQSSQTSSSQSSQSLTSQENQLSRSLNTLFSTLSNKFPEDMNNNEDDDSFLTNQQILSLLDLKEQLKISKKMLRKLKLRLFVMKSCLDFLKSGKESVILNYALSASLRNFLNKLCSYVNNRKADKFAYSIENYVWLEIKQCVGENYVIAKSDSTAKYFGFSKIPIGNNRTPCDVNQSVNKEIKAQYTTGVENSGSNKDSQKESVTGNELQNKTFVENGDNISVGNDDKNTHISSDTGIENKTNIGVKIDTIVSNCNEKADVLNDNNIIQNSTLVQNCTDDIVAKNDKSNIQNSKNIFHFGSINANTAIFNKSEHKSDEDKDGFKFSFNEGSINAANSVASEENKNVPFTNVRIIQQIGKIMTVETAAKVQNRISNAITPNFLPVLKCHGIKSDSLIYSCYNEKSFNFLRDVLNDFQIVKYEISGSYKMSVTVRYFEGSLKNIFDLLKIYHDLNFERWDIQQATHYDDRIEFVVSMDSNSFDYICRNNFRLFAGIDEFMFDIVV